ncbi:hypothetical protein cyc_06289 [Cyclospora cayetanensis]|uniref:Uncharacterized protein n=1 Tax=Cyclospora cayetanensis TaxID=88456 RepID=A0A1D3CZE6_9EIME|nr:hypothetical protein cyc_06289 [Cyclospora cayetanensis]
MDCESPVGHYSDCGVSNNWKVSPQFYPTVQRRTTQPQHNVGGDVVVLSSPLALFDSPSLAGYSQAALVESLGVRCAPQNDTGIAVPPTVGSPAGALVGNCFTGICAVRDLPLPCSGAAPHRGFSCLSAWSSATCCHGQAGGAPCVGVEAIPYGCVQRQQLPFQPVDRVCGEAAVVNRGSAFCHVGAANAPLYCLASPQQPQRYLCGTLQQHHYQQQQAQSAATYCPCYSTPCQQPCCVENGYQHPDRVHPQDCAGLPCCTAYASTVAQQALPAMCCGCSPPPVPQQQQQQQLGVPPFIEQMPPLQHGLGSVEQRPQTVELQPVLQRPTQGPLSPVDASDGVQLCGKDKEPLLLPERDHGLFPDNNLVLQQSLELESQETVAAKAATGRSAGAGKVVPVVGVGGLLCLPPRGLKAKATAAEWHSGFRYPLGKDGRAELIKRMRVVHRHNKEFCDSTLNALGISFRRLSHATVEKLWQLAYQWGLFAFGLRVARKSANWTPQAQQRRKSAVAAKEASAEGQCESDAVGVAAGSDSQDGEEGVQSAEDLQTFEFLLHAKEEGDFPFGCAA